MKHVDYASQPSGKLKVAHTMINQPTSITASVKKIYTIGWPGYVAYKEKMRYGYEIFSHKISREDTKWENNVKNEHYRSRT
jgi:hypothetical protein